jgi:hypothetical protein
MDKWIPCGGLAPAQAYAYTGCKKQKNKKKTARTRSPIVELEIDALGDLPPCDGEQNGAAAGVAGPLVVVNSQGRLNNVLGLDKDELVRDNLRERALVVPGGHGFLHVPAGWVKRKKKTGTESITSSRINHIITNQSHHHKSTMIRWGWKVLGIKDARLPTPRVDGLIINAHTHTTRHK